MPAAGGWRKTWGLALVAVLMASVGLHVIHPLFHREAHVAVAERGRGNDASVAAAQLSKSHDCPICRLLTATFKLASRMPSLPHLGAMATRCDLVPAPPPCGTRTVACRWFHSRAPPAGVPESV